MLGPEKALEDIKFICSLIHKHTLRAYYVLGTILADTDVRVHKTRHSPLYHEAHGLVRMMNINFKISQQCKCAKCIRRGKRQHERVLQGV